MATSGYLEVMSNKPEMLTAALESHGNLYLGQDEHGIAVGCHSCGRSYSFPPSAAEARTHQHGKEPLANEDILRRFN